MKKRPSHHSRVSHDRWLISYADFITLLFGLFVVMYAFVKAGEKREAQVSKAIESGFRVMGIYAYLPDHNASQLEEVVGRTNSTIQVQKVMVEDLESPARARFDLEQIREMLIKRLKNEMASGTVGIAMGTNGLVISLREAGFFNSGSATPRKGTRVVLDSIGAALAESGMQVRVEGHTDDVPIHDFRFDSNWELSAARAAAIARMLLEIHAIAPQNLSAAGYGQYHPVATNQTAAGRAKNRRVDLVIFPHTKVDFSVAVGGNSSQGSWKRITDP
jgi:chemotaxis protein MotB